MADQELDASGLNCPLPILRAKKTLNGMEAGTTLHIIATDPGSVKDFEAFCKQTFRPISYFHPNLAPRSAFVCKI